MKDHIATLKGKSVSACTASVNNATLIALWMFKFDLQQLSSKLRQNREAHVDYLKYIKKHADTLYEMVEKARALKPLDKVLDYACKFTTRIQELLIYVSATLPSSQNESEKLVVVTPMNKNKKVRFADPRTSTSNTQNRTKSVKSIKKNEWKPTGKVFTNVGNRWLPTGRTFTID
ncbi:hypothetical protein Tco_1114721 [Tanacetum coccineum]|uniref:Uncharacterized protein n=1 Tax=Tanacetum coccineum TaxID=301880 RepID=A0ABQ5IYW0_9ASTR